MAEKDQIIKEKLDHSGIFNFAELYSFMHDFLKDSLCGVNEEKYSEKVAGSARDITFEWKATRKLGDYFKIEHTIMVVVTGMTDVEVEIDKKKKKMNKGKIAVEIKGVLIKDYKNYWSEANPILKFLRETYDKFIIPKRVDSMENKIEKDVRDFKDEIKAYLELTGKR